MSENYKMRLGATLEFDAGKEIDLIKNIKDLTNKHKLGLYINQLLRYVWDNPEKFKGTDVDPFKSGVSMKREVYFNNIEKRVKSCEKSLNEMYREMIVLMTAAKVGSTFGLVENASDFLLGLECVESYIKKLKEKLNIDIEPNLFESDKISKSEEIANRAADILVKIMVAKNVDLRIRESTSTKDISSIDNNKVVKSVNENEPKHNDVVTGSGSKQPYIKKETDIKVDNNADAVSDDLITAFCGV